VTRRLLLVRHGESEANVVASLDCSVPGPPITALGRLQAEQLVDVLAGEDIRSVWASTMTRAQQTAAPLAAARGLPVWIRDDLREVGVGDLNARRDDEAHDVFLDVVAGWMLRAERDLRCPGGESGAEAVARFTGVLDEVVSTLDDGAAVVVAHGAVLRTTLLALCGLEPAFVFAHHLPNAGVVEVDLVDGAFACRSWAGHVPELGTAGPSRRVW
jgi:probable phosphoglycerate mutase